MGSFFYGPARLSLVDTKANRLVNTIKLRRKEHDEDSFNVPYRVLAGYYYFVPDRERGQEGTPTLLALRDLNGDGLPLETAFFEARACMGVWTTLFGYSPKQDRVVQYQVELKITEQKIVEGRGIVTTGRAKTETATWVDYLFSESPSEPGHWSYKIDYTGRAGTLDTYDVHYDRAREKFFGTLLRLTPPWANQ